MTTLRRYCWPLVIAVSGIAVALTMFAGFGSPLRPIVVIWFLTVCPGMALVRMLPIKDGLTEFTLGIAVSLAMDALLAEVMVYTKLWSSAWALGILVGISYAGAASQVVRTRMAEHDRNGDIRVLKIAAAIALMIVVLVIVGPVIVASRHSSSASRSTNTPVKNTGGPAAVVIPSLPAPPLTFTPIASMGTIVSVPTANVSVTATDVPAMTPTHQVASTSTSVVGTVSATAPAGTRYIDPQGRFSFTRPDDWRPLQLQDPKVAIQFVSDKPRGNLNVVAQPVAITLTVDQYASAVVADITQTYPAYRQDPRGIESATLGGGPARQYSFQGMQDGTPIEFTQVVALKDGVAYVVTVTAAADESSDFAAQTRVVIETFAFHA